VKAKKLLVTFLISKNGNENVADVVVVAVAVACCSEKK
jgi:hypothetical protein